MSVLKNKNTDTKEVAQNDYAIYDTVRSYVANHYKVPEYCVNPEYDSIIDGDSLLVVKQVYNQSNDTSFTVYVRIQDEEIVGFVDFDAIGKSESLKKDNNANASKANRKKSVVLLHSSEKYLATFYQYDTEDKMLLSVVIEDYVNLLKSQIDFLSIFDEEEIIDLCNTFNGTLIHSAHPLNAIIVMELSNYFTLEKETEINSVLIDKINSLSNFECFTLYKFITTNLDNPDVIFSKLSKK